MKTKETYIIYGSLESAYEHMKKKEAAPWNYRVKKIELGRLNTDNYWIKIIYEYDDDDDDDDEEEES